MSRKSNPLARYRSYSYYHVLAMCSTSDVASELAGSTKLDMWQSSNVGGVLKPKKLTTQAGEGQYYVLVNGSTDAALTITKANWTSFTASSATMDDRGTSIATEGSISISEPKGIVFLDNIVKCCMAMGIDSASAFWVLKTFFVGYTFENNKDGVEHITDIPPVIFMAYDVTGSFGVAGGEYEISFMAAANSASRLPQYSKAVRSMNFSASDTFHGALINLEKEITNNYRSYYDCLHGTISRIKGAEEVAASLRPVTYVIQAGAPYANNSAYFVGDQPVQLKDSPDCGSPANISIAAGTTIEDAIHRIISMCSKIKTDAAVGDNGKKYIAKIHSWVTSKETSEKGKLEYEVGYRVERQEDPHSMSFEDAGKNADNIIEFDYIYTGKNIDILEFDLKMNMGLVYLQSMTIANTYKQPNQQAPTVSTHPAIQDIKSRQQSKNIPVFFGSSIKSSWIKNSQDPAVNSQFAYSMTKHAALETIEAVVKITGNPSLLGSINQTTDPRFVSLQVAPVLSSDGFARFTNWTTAPAFAKINIKMPRTNDDIALFTGKQTGADNPSESNDYAVDFWFNGHYFIYGIDNVFDNGEFHQTLQTLGISANNTYKPPENTVDISAVLSAKLDECYEHRYGCGTVAIPGDAAPINISNYVPEHHESVTSPRGKLEMYEATITGPTSLDQVAIYNVATNEVKAAIANTAAKYPNIKNLEPIMAALISRESTFVPTKTNKDGYMGLGQFGATTWAEYGKGSPYNAQANTDAIAAYMVANITAFHKEVSLAPPTLTDLFVLHQRGTTGGLQILKNVYSGNGNAPVKYLSNDSADKNAIKRGATCRELYDTLAKHMGMQLTSTAVVPSPGPRKPIESLPDPNKTVINLPTKPTQDLDKDPTIISLGKQPQPERLGPGPSTASPDTLTIKEILAAYTTCMDQEKMVIDQNKQDGCNPVPETETQDPTRPERPTERTDRNGLPYPPKPTNVPTTPSAPIVRQPIPPGTPPHLGPGMMPAEPTDPAVRPNRPPADPTDPDIHPTVLRTRSTFPDTTIA